jgi:hypothetical protein
MWRTTAGPMEHVVIPSVPAMETIYLRDIHVTTGQAKIGVWVKTFGGSLAETHHLPR